MLLLSAVIACKLLQLMGIQNKRYSLNTNLQLIFLHGTAISLTFHKDVFCVHCRLRLIWERYWRSSKEFLPKKWSFSELRVSQRVVWLGKIVWRLLIIGSTCQISVHRRFAIGNSDEIPLYTSGEYFWILARRSYVILLPLWTKCHATLPFLLLLSVMWRKIYYMSHAN